MTNTCVKGKVVERDGVHWLKDRGVTSARRTQQHNGNDGKSDIVAPKELPHFHIESKGKKNPHIPLSMLKKWYEQITRDCEEGQIPVVMFRANGKEPLFFFKRDATKELIPGMVDFIICMDKSFHPHKMLEDRCKTKRIMYLFNHHQETVSLAVFELVPGAEFYAVDGDEGLAMMMNYEERVKEEEAA